MHWHEHIELLYFTKGTGYVYCGMKKINVTKGTLVIVNSNELHMIHTDNKLEYYCAIISPSMFMDIHNVNCIFQNSIVHDEYVAQCFSRLYDEYSTMTEGYDMAMKGIVYSLFAYLVRNYKEINISLGDYNKRLVNTERANSIIMYVNSHYSEKLSLASLASANHVSKYYLCHFFKEITGFTVLEYIKYTRVEKSKNLLGSTNLGVGEVASAVGYDDVNYFCRVFKKYAKLSPGQYKKHVFNKD